jgi:hypothetical protein
MFGQHSETKECESFVLREIISYQVFLISKEACNKLKLQFEVRIEHLQRFFQEICHPEVFRVKYFIVCAPTIVNLEIISFGSFPSFFYCLIESNYVQDRT